MADWQIALLSISAALLGGFLQFLYTKLIDTKRRVREVRDKRIDSYEKLMNSLFIELWELLEIFEQSLEEVPDTKIKNRVIEIMRERGNQDNRDLKLLEACGKSLHDESLDKYSSRLGRLKHMTMRAFFSIPRAPREFAKMESEKRSQLYTFQEISMTLLSKIYERLDYLRAK
jgi:hypothetical protein